MARRGPRRRPTPGFRDVNVTPLVDVMLVFACGLIAALIASNPQLSQALAPTVETIEQGRELPSLPENMGDDGSGFESVGTVYRDPETGRLILVGP